MAGLIQLSPADLMAQSAKLSSLQGEFETLFSSITSELNSVNSNWSTNLANNFAGKITSAQNGLAQVVQLLGNGAKAAATSAETFSSVDTALQNLTQTDASPLATSAMGSVSLSQKSDAKSVSKDIWNNVVDNSRESGGQPGNSKGIDSATWSTEKSGSQTILDANFKYTKYTDYTTLSALETKGDDFYSFNTGLKREGTHINYNDWDDPAINGSITLNGVSAYADASIDPLKGSAYVKAGADYSIVKASIGAERKYGSFSLSGEVGAGAHLDAGIHNGKITVDASAAAVFGAGVKFEINYGQFLSDLRNGFSS